MKNLTITDNTFKNTERYSVKTIDGVNNILARDGLSYDNLKEVNGCKVLVTKRFAITLT